MAVVINNNNKKFLIGFILIASQAQLEQNCLPSSSHFSLEWKVCHVMQQMLIFLMSKTSLQAKTAIAIRKNEN